MNIEAKKIQVYLAEKNMNQSDLATKCGISRQTLNAIIRRGTCNAKIAGKLALGLDVSVSEIIKE